MVTFHRLLLAFLFMLFSTATAHSAPLKVACAANFTAPMKELAARYETATGKTVHCAFGSTGMLYGQIINGAPYDLFFAADRARPAKLLAEGLAFEPTTYAHGKVVLWSSKAALRDMEQWQAVIASPGVTRIGIANPKTAPYGEKALKAMTENGLFELVKLKLAFGKSVGTAFQYAYTGSADASFVALSQAISPKGTAGRYWPVPEAGIVEQAACVLNHGNVEAAKQFLEWLGGKAARSLISGYGYE